MKLGKKANSKIRAELEHLLSSIPGWINRLQTEPESAANIALAELENSAWMIGGVVAKCTKESGGEIATRQDGPQGSLCMRREGNAYSGTKIPFPSLREKIDGMVTNE